MDWQEIQISNDNTSFLYNGTVLYNKQFLQVMKFHAPGIAPVSDDSGWYHISVDGTPIYKERYTHTFGFYFDRAVVVLNGKWFHVDTKGYPTYTERYVWAGNYQENLCTVRDSSNKYFHIDSNGKRISLDSFIYAGDFKDGYACVKTNLGWKHIDSSGNALNCKYFLDLGVFHKSVATAKDKDGWFHINKNGDGLYNQRYLSIEPFYNGFSKVIKFDHTHLIINERGDTIITLQ